MHYPGQVKIAVGQMIANKDAAQLAKMFFNQNLIVKDISRHPLTYSRKVGQVVFVVGQVKIQNSENEEQGKQKLTSLSTATGVY